MIRFDGVTKRYGLLAAVDSVSLEVRARRICVLLGESGSGKSTLMRMVNRLVEPDAGRIMLDGRDIATVPAEALRHGIGYVIQSVGLFPHWRVAQNVATVPRLLGWDEARIAARVDALLELAGLPPAEFRDRYPHELSGGQAQRVGLARALAADPPVLLMDEPFSALDPGIRRGLQAELRRIHAETGKTILFVTHDVEEALLLADELAVMRDGRLVAHGPPARVLARDAGAEVRNLFGEATMAFHRLGTLPAAPLARSGDGAAAPLLAGDATLKQALMLMLEHGTDRLALAGGGALHLSDILAAA
ncbi:ABC transporter ATP-binding protein [Roseomonas marmotae]|uniref:ABC transporter ATP-binding protein n=1 Tax=Roseomonas marmotae TaxID=2768161 RepID=A0ABS3KHN3_9PROT|nr:ABC transporter ATP-binding protein [Roseomonas marmotae]MBO1076972.1 ABC transporter ATP-binding protein [Roseomonas marmotae]QTI80060.1 ABC transporter ATP-binding protein [Roseomonas marmotae]